MKPNYTWNPIFFYFTCFAIKIWLDLNIFAHEHAHTNTQNNLISLVFNLRIVFFIIISINFNKEIDATFCIRISVSRQFVYHVYFIRSNLPDFYLLLSRSLSLLVWYEMYSEFITINDHMEIYQANKRFALQICNYL